MSCRKIILLFILAVGFLSCLNIIVDAELHVGFYEDTCHDAESIVRDEVQKAFSNNKGIAPGLLRMHFHDCFIRGCDASVLVDSTPTNAAEKEGLPNKNSLRGFEVIDNAKARLEAVCRGIVSCADILAFAARDSAELTKGFRWEVPAGRRDGRTSLAAESLELPPFFFKVDQLTQSFANKGLTQEDMVALSGAHTIGRSHCTSFTERLYNFTTTTRQDPNLNSFYANQLKQQCPKDPQGRIDPDLEVQMNGSPSFMDPSYYADLLVDRGLFTSDQTLLTNPATVNLVKLYAINGFIWQNKFVEAMVKMSKIDVLTGNDGEIRSNCRAINS